VVSPETFGYTLICKLLTRLYIWY